MAKTAQATAREFGIGIAFDRDMYDDAVIMELRPSLDSTQPIACYMSVGNNGEREFELTYRIATGDVGSVTENLPKYISSDTQLKEVVMYLATKKHLLK